MTQGRSSYHRDRMRALRAVLVATLLVMAAAPLSAQTALDEAVALFEKRQYAQAASQLAGVVAAEPGNARARAYYGMALANAKGDLDGAVAQLEKAVSLDPASSRYQVWLGSIYSSKAGQSGLFKAASLAGKAKGAFEKAVALDPSSVEARQALLQYYLLAPGVAGGSVGKARDQASAIGALDAHRGHLAVARIAEYEKEWPAAEKAYRNALALQPDRAATHNSLGYALLREGRSADAIAEFRRYVELAPEDANAHDSLGEGLLAAGKTEEAAASYRRATELDPKFSSSVWGLGDCLDRLGRKDEAAAQYKRYLELAPKGGFADESRKRLSRR
jgi:tetratricopeptide (TPR) repeat protein